MCATAMPTSPDQLPARIGRYEIQKELGRGAMGVVYQALDPALGRIIALKTVRLTFAFSEQQRATFEQRFLTEARVAAQLQHPGIVVVHDIGRDAATGLLYIALEFLVGETISDLIASGRRLEWREVLRIVARVAEALHHAHMHGVVHRDVKPANIMLLRSGAPKIMDFGIAKIEASTLTSPGELFGTPLYMSPEQAQGEAVDARSDLFSLGSIAYTLLTGEAAFKAPNVPNILARVLHFEPTPPSESGEGIPEDVDYVVARAMAKAPEQRYASGRDMTEDIEDVCAGRTPRHRGNWRMPERGNATMVAARGVERAGKAQTPDLAAELVPADLTPPRAKRRRRLPLAELSLLLLAAAAGLLYVRVDPSALGFWESVWRQVSGPQTSTVAAPSQTPEAAPRPTPDPAPGSGSSPAPPTTGDAGATPTPEGAPSVEPPTAMSPEVAASAIPTSAAPATPTPQSVTAPQPEASAAPAAEATPSPRPASAASPPKARPTPTPGNPAATARLRVDFEHRLKSGVLRVWVDERLVLNEKLDARVTQKILMFEVRKGHVQQLLRLVPGAHEIRVLVRWGSSSDSERITGVFAPNATRRLEVRVSQGKLSLRWK
jgi:hypothetical protein